MTDKEQRKFNWLWKEETAYILSIGLTVLGGLLLIWFFIALACFGHLWFTHDLNLGKASNIGEFVGGVIGTLFTIVGIILLFLTYNTQKRELSATKEELKLSREIFEKQSRTAQIQQFESTFFNLLSNHYELVNSIKQKWFNNDFPDQNPEFYYNREIFEKTAEFIKKLYEFDLKGFTPIVNGVRASIQGGLPVDQELTKFGAQFSEENGLDKIIKIYSLVFNNHRSAFSQYFRNLYHFIKFINDYTGFDPYFKEEEILELKYKYIRILRAQLSPSEIIVLWYNSLMGFGVKFQKYIGIYRLLKNIDFRGDVAAPELMIKQYNYLREVWGEQMENNIAEEMANIKEDNADTNPIS